MICFIDGTTAGKANVPTVGLSVEAIGRCEMSQYTEDWLEQVFEVVGGKD